MVGFLLGLLCSKVVCTLSALLGLPQTASFHLVIHVMFSPWQQKARDNRAAQRISKVQLSGDPVKRQQAAPAPLPAAYEPACVEVEGGFKDPLKSKESEQEQEWKLRQVSLAVADFDTQTQRGITSTAWLSCHCSGVALVMLLRLVSKLVMSTHSSKSVQPDRIDFVV